jgi:holliday junction resolvase YEN1
MQCQSTFSHNHAQFGQNPELRTLFYRLAGLLCYCADFVFVFDGPHRASIKRGKKVKTTPHWLTSGMQEMLTAFGFAWYIVGTFPTLLYQFLMSI